MPCLTEQKTRHDHALPDGTKNTARQSVKPEFLLSFGIA